MSKREKDLKRTDKDKKTEKAPMPKKKLVTIIIASIAAALVLCAAIIIPIVLLGNGEETPDNGGSSYTLDGTYVLNVGVDSFESNSTYVFSGKTATNTYFDGDKKVTVNYTFEIEKQGDTRVIKLRNTETGIRNEYSYSEVTENGKLTSLIINGVWYTKQ